jgi:FMN-dependent NADH-azoreductase
MAKVLFVTGNPKATELSRSRSIAEVFRQEYVKLNPSDVVTDLDLYREDIPLLDESTLSGWQALMDGAEFSALTGEQQSKIGRINELADQFVAAQKYVFVTPMWNFNMPPLVKAYIDTVCIPGKGFEYGPEGAVGLLRNQGRKFLHVLASGGLHAGKSWDHSTPYLRDIMGFMGIEDFEAIRIEGMDALPDQADKIMAEARQTALKIAARF